MRRRRIRCRTALREIPRFGVRVWVLSMWFLPRDDPRSPEIDSFQEMQPNTPSSRLYIKLSAG
jgi:hypothetical protein